MLFPEGCASSLEKQLIMSVASTLFTHSLATREMPYIHSFKSQHLIVRNCLMEFSLAYGKLTDSWVFHVSHTPGATKIKTSIKSWDTCDWGFPQPPIQPSAVGIFSSSSFGINTTPYTEFALGTKSIMSHAVLLAVISKRQVCPAHGCVSSLP